MERFDRSLEDLLRISRREGFWNAQKARILRNVEPELHGRKWSTQIFFPALAGVVVAIVIAGVDPESMKVPFPANVSSPQIEAVPSADEWDLLEKLPLLEHWEEIQHSEKGRP
jgi:hypothetical protein